MILFDLLAAMFLVLPLGYFIGPEWREPMILGLVITSVLAIASYFPFTRIKNGTMNKFMMIMMGGMLLRMFAIAASIAYVFLFTEIHQIGFTVGLLFSYICKSALETYILTRKKRGQSTA